MNTTHTKQEKLLPRDEVAKRFGEMAAMMLWREATLAGGDRIFRLTPLFGYPKYDVELRMVVRDGDLFAKVMS